MKEVTFRAGETAPPPVVFNCAPGADPEPVLVIPVRDGDRITLDEQGRVVSITRD